MMAQGARAKQCRAPPWMPGSTFHARVSQHEAGTASVSNLFAETIGFRACIGPDPHLIERPGATAAPYRTQKTRIAVADHSAEPPDGSCVHGHGADTAEAGCELYAP